MIILKNKKAFTLIEVMVSIILSAIIIFFIYTMMTVSYTSYSKLFGVSQQKNNTRFFESMMKKSIENSVYVQMLPSKFSFGYYDDNLGIYRRDDYSFTTGSFTNSKALSSNPPTVMASIPSANRVLVMRVYNAGSNYTGNTLIRTEVILENVNAVYYYMDSTGIMRNISIGLIFNKVLSDGEVNYEIRTFIFTSRDVLV
ncbi:MAG: prepilin-type N-terminal cleavage/methylation domain-containing protein [Endomicrobiaceae bacterium]